MLKLSGAHLRTLKVGAGRFQPIFSRRRGGCSCRHYEGSPPLSLTPGVPEARSLPRPWGCPEGGLWGQGPTESQTCD